MIDVDDVIRNLLVDIFEQEGFMVDQANDGQAGLNQVQLNMPQLIVLDLMMPHMDGYAFMNALGALLRTEPVPIVVLSASYRPGSADQGLGARGPTAYMSKPFDITVLVDLVRRMTGYADSPASYASA